MNETEKKKPKRRKPTIMGILAMLLVIVTGIVYRFARDLYRFVQAGAATLLGARSENTSAERDAESSGSLADDLRQLHDYAEEKRRREGGAPRSSEASRDVALPAQIPRVSARVEKTPEETLAEFRAQRKAREIPPEVALAGPSPHQTTPPTEERK